MSPLSLTSQTYPPHLWSYYSPGLASDAIGGVVPLARELANYFLCSVWGHPHYPDVWVPFHIFLHYSFSACLSGKLWMLIQVPAKKGKIHSGTTTDGIFKNERWAHRTLLGTKMCVHARVCVRVCFSQGFYSSVYPVHPTVFHIWKHDLLLSHVRSSPELSNLVNGTNHPFGGAKADAWKPFLMPPFPLKPQSSHSISAVCCISPTNPSWNQATFSLFTATTPAQATVTSPPEPFISGVPMMSWGRRGDEQPRTLQGKTYWPAVGHVDRRQLHCSCRGCLRCWRATSPQVMPFPGHPVQVATLGSRNVWSFERW